MNNRRSIMIENLVNRKWEKESKVKEDSQFSPFILFFWEWDFMAVLFWKSNYEEISASCHP